MASLTYPLVAATDGIAYPTDFVESMERLATHKANAQIQHTRTVCHSAIRVNSTASGK